MKLSNEERAFLMEQHTKKTNAIQAETIATSPAISTQDTKTSKKRTSEEETPGPSKPEEDGFTKAKRTRTRKTSQPSTPALETGNRFQPLTDSEDEMAVEEVPTPGTQPAAARPRPPPPVVLRDKAAWTTVARQLDHRALKFTKAKNIQDGIAIQPATSDDFRGITKMLDEGKLPYHSFLLQEEKPLKVVLRGLPIDLPAGEIKEDLARQGLPVRTVTRMTGRNRVPIPLFLVQLERTTEARKIYDITATCYLQVRVESPRRQPAAVSQCHRCQRFHHAQSRCHATPRCVKCGQEHHSAQCTKPREEPAKCANCTLAHPASYRGCAAFPKPPPAFHRTAPSGPSAPRRHGVSYARATQPEAASTAQPRAAPKEVPTPAEQPTPQPTPVEDGKAKKMQEVIKLVTTALTSCSDPNSLIAAVLGCLPAILSLLTN